MVNNCYHNLHRKNIHNFLIMRKIDYTWDLFDEKPILKMEEEFL